MRIIVSLLLSALILSSNQAYSSSIPRPIGGESRIKIINYTPNTVFKFVGHYEYQSIIEFGADEEIDTITMGTPTPWQIVPTGNRIFIKPVEEQATTNMTVITNKRMYFFEMHAEEAVSVNDESLSFVVKFVYPEQFQYGGVTSVGDQVKPDPTQPEKYNYDYSISGNAKNIEPTQVFDDGEFTFFKFKDVNAEIPAIFMVNRDGSEALVNFRVNGGYIIVERVADRFTLRRGSDTICVFNEKSDYKKPEKKRFLIF